jgi:hypothetical protein
VAGEAGVDDDGAAQRHEMRPSHTEKKASRPEKSPLH